MNMLVSVIIPHHNNSKILIECINSLTKSTFENIEIIVVDNASSDSSYDDVIDNFPNIIIKKSDINLGYAGGCNLGAQIANGQYLLFLNNDTVVSEHCIEKLVLQLEQNKNIASVQPKIININNQSYFDYAGASGGFIDYLVFPFTRGRIFDTIEKDIAQYNNPIKIFWASGAGFLTRKNIFKKVSGFDNDLFAHMEEIDYHWKCHLIKSEVWVNPEAVLYHHGGKTLSMDSPKKTYFNHRNSMILLLSNYSFLHSFLFFIVRIPLEIISSLKELLSLRLRHFINHYLALVWILFHPHIIKNRRSLINQIRSVKDNHIFNKNIILKRSIVMDYFLFGKKFFRNIKKLN